MRSASSRSRLATLLEELLGAGDGAAPRGGLGGPQGRPAGGLGALRGRVELGSPSEVEGDQLGQLGDPLPGPRAESPPPPAREARRARRGEATSRRRRGSAGGGSCSDPARRRPAPGPAPCARAFASGPSAGSSEQVGERRAAEAVPEDRGVLKRALLVRPAAGRCAPRSPPGRCRGARRRAPFPVPRRSSARPPRRRTGFRPMPRPPVAPAPLPRSGRAARSAGSRPRVCSGRSSIWVTLRVVRPKSGRRSASSGRLVQSSTSGADWTRNAASSSRSSNPSSAQCASSIPSTSGRSSASRATKRRHACLSSSSPTPELSMPSPPSATLSAPAISSASSAPNSLEQAGERALDLGDRGVLAHPGGVAEDLGQGPEGDPAPVGRVASEQHPRRARARRAAREAARSPAASCRSPPRR